MVCEVEHRRSHGKLKQVATRSKHKNLVLIEIHLKLVHRLHTLRVLQHTTYVSKPLVKSRLALHAFVSPVGSHTTLGHLVHALGAYLHLHPFLFRTEHGDMQTLITIRLRYR